MKFPSHRNFANKLKQLTDNDLLKIVIVREKNVKKMENSSLETF